MLTNVVHVLMSIRKLIVVAKLHLEKAFGSVVAPKFSKKKNQVQSLAFPVKGS